ncbi:MAG: hypothetical protein JSV56_02840 [Methanomassiliicoccales archaeon]|nr:MAG: hypothetical protein JSV56_02840 [Methanomassiliicoccales archaeon]
MPHFGLLKGRENNVTTKTFAVVVLIAFITYTITIIILWTTFLPQMESATEETESLMGNSRRESDSIIHGDYISEIKLVFIASLICYGLFDTIFSLMLWRGEVPKNQEKMVEVLAQTYVTKRAFSLFLATMLPIIVLVGSNPELPMNIFYLVVPIFSIISLVFILYFNRKIFEEKVEDEPLYKIHDENIF